MKNADPPVVGQVTPKKTGQAQMLRIIADKNLICVNLLNPRHPCSLLNRTRIRQ